MERSSQSAVSKTLTKQSKVPVEAAMRDPLLNPDGVFDKPSAVLLDRDLSTVEKARALDNWEQTVRQRLAATDEGMDANDTSASDLQLLERIEHARKQISATPRHVTESMQRDASTAATRSATARPHDHDEQTEIAPTAARQGSGKLTNYRVLENSLLIAVFVGAALLIAFYLA